jgi:hypothetical protein
VSFAAQHLLLPLAFWPLQPPAGPVGPALPRITQDRGCDQPATGSNEIVVCGESSEDSPYRIPKEFRGQGLIEDRHASWDTRIRDQEALERFSNQNIGPSGITQHSRQVDCQWRVARQEMRGERPDCGKGKSF